MYYKACTKDLTGYGGFQFETGKVYETDNPDDWRWFHYTKALKDTLRFYHEPDTRFLEVKPLGHRRHFVTGDSNYWTTDKLQIVRELGREEVYALLLEEGCSFYDLCQLDPPYEIMKKILPKRLSDGLKQRIATRPDLTLEQKKDLLPVSWHKHLHEKV